MPKMSEFIRTAFLKTDLERDKGLTTPDSVERFDDIVYGSDSKGQVLDVYRPKEKTGERLPVIVSVHGGGWVYGDKERYQYYCLDLATRGYAVVNFTYRLAPENQFPAGLEDTTMVFQWVFDHAQEYGFDTSRIYAVGDSAGGHYLMMFTSLCTNEEYAKLFSFKAPEGFVPRAIGLNCAAIQLEMSDKPEAQFFTNLMKEVLPNQGSELELKQINTLPYVNEKFPPVFLMTSEADFLQKDALALSEKLIEMHIPFEFRYYCDPKEKLGHVFHLNIRSENAKICNDEECAFFELYK